MGDYQKLIFTYLDHVWRRRNIALICAWVVCALGWAVISLLPDKYDSEARVYVDTQSLLNPLLKGISVASEDQRRDQEVSVMQRTLTSRPNLAKVAQLTDLDKSTTTAAQLQKLLDNLEDRIEVSNQGNNLFRVRYTDNSPAMAKRVVQALLTIFVESSVGDRRADMQSARSFIETQLEEYEKKLNEAEKKLADFKIENVDFISNVGSENFSTRLERARITLKENKRALEDLESQREQIREQLSETPQFLSIDAAPQVVIGDGGNTLEQRIRTLQKNIGELRLQYTDKHPEIVRSLQALKDLQEEQKKPAGAADSDPVNSGGRDRSEVPNELYSQLSLRLADIQSKITSAKNRVSDANEELTDLEKKTVEGPKVEAEFTALTRGYQVLKGNYESLLSRRESARIGEAADSSSDAVQFRIVAEPEEPAFPTGPNRRLFNIAVLILGIGAGCGLTILIARVQDCVTIPEDLAEFGDHNFLGTISVATTLSLPQAFHQQYRRFTIALGALCIASLVTVAIAPNFSTYPAALALRLTSQ
jgi:polysaccharide chain length determinant protein (PEP-CTERM system associated)